MKKKLANLIVIVAIVGLFHVYAVDAMKNFTVIEQAASDIYHRTN